MIPSFSKRATEELQGKSPPFRGAKRKGRGGPSSLVNEDVGKERKKEKKKKGISPAEEKKGALSVPRMKL